MPDKTEPEKLISVSIAVTVDQHRRWKIWAKSNHRTMTSQVKSAIDEAVPPTEQTD